MEMVKQEIDPDYCILPFSRQETEESFQCKEEIKLEEEEIFENDQLCGAQKEISSTDSDTVFVEEGLLVSNDIAGSEKLQQDNEIWIMNKRFKSEYTTSTEKIPEPFSLQNVVDKKTQKSLITQFKKEPEYKATLTDVEDPAERKRRLAKERKARWLAKKPKKAKMADGEDPKARKRRQAKERKARWLAKKGGKAKIVDDEESAEKKRRLAKERKARWWAKQSPESLTIIRAKAALRRRLRRESETDAEKQARRALAAAAQKLRRVAETEEQKEVRRLHDLEYHQYRLERELPEENQQRRAKLAASRRHRRHCLPEETYEQTEI